MFEAVMITGGAGFLGTNLLLKMVKMQYAKRYIVVDNFKTRELEYGGVDPDFTKLLSKHGIGNIVDVMCKDICEGTFVSEVKSKYDQLDEIFHFASLASPPFYKRYPMETLDVGYIGTKNVLDLCLHYNCKLLYSSTSEVYGDALIHPQIEDYYGNVNTFGERSCYDESKRIGETLIYTYQKLHNLDAKIVRIFNTYGPYMSLGDGRIVTEIIRCLIFNVRLNIYGNGEQTRSLSFVDDTLEMILRVMSSDFKQPVNVGSEYEVSVNKLVEKVCEIYDQVNKVGMKNSYQILKRDYINIDKDDPKVRKPDLTLNKMVIGEYNRKSLEEGIKHTVEYFINLYDPTNL
jgi:nucleoside-diphosphate-sugar epimerase